jgi:methyl-accepting chemotaxis protein
MDNQNQDIKKKLLLLPVVIISIVAITMTIGILTIVFSTLDASQVSAVKSQIYTYSILMSLGVIVFFSLFITFLFKKNFISKLNKLQAGIFGFLDYLGGDKEEITYIDDNVGGMSDAINARMKVIEKNISKNQQFINEFIDTVNKVESGKYGYRIKSKPHDKLLNEAYIGINKMLESLELNIGKDLQPILKTLEYYAKEDYTHPIQNPQGNIEISINNLADVIIKMLTQYKENGLIIQDKTQSVKENITTVHNQIGKDVKTNLGQIVNTVEEITKHIKINVENASFMTSYSESVTQSAKDGENLAVKTAEAMSDISNQVENINEAIAIIDKITMQTNILSLNAAVEASTAGDAGKGFAVVAQEVRNLASQTAKASKDIQVIVEKAKEKAQVGNTISSEMIDGYHQLVEEVSKTMELIYSITQSSNIQDENNQKIHDLVLSLDGVVDKSIDNLINAKDFSVSNYEMIQMILKGNEDKKIPITDNKGAIYA